MIKVFVIFLVFIWLPASGQSCLCPADGFEEGLQATPLDVFSFKNGSKIQICPPIQWISDGDGETYYRDFGLYNCYDNTLIYNDDSYNDSFITFKNDTLIIELKIYLPTAKNRSFEFINQKITKIFVKNAKFDKSEVLTTFRKYSKKEIRQTIAEFKAGPKALKEDVENLIARLFVAALSDPKAQQHFINFNNEFMELDGGAMEDYRDFRAMLGERR